MKETLGGFAAKDVSSQFCFVLNISLIWLEADSSSFTVNTDIGYIAGFSILKSTSYW